MYTVCRIQPVACGLPFFKVWYKQHGVKEHAGSRTRTSCISYTTMVSHNSLILSTLLYADLVDIHCIRRLLYQPIHHSIIKDTR